MERYPTVAVGFKLENAHVSPTFSSDFDEAVVHAAGPHGHNVPSLTRLAPRQGRGANSSDFGVFGKGKRIFHVDPEIAQRILDLAMIEDDLEGTKVAGRRVDDRCLRSPK